MDVILLDWAEFMLRWLHVIAGMAWIGASFYFMHLDASLKPVDDIPEGKGGEAWEVHGGGFYQNRKYFTAPAQMPDHLTWHKWQAYTTWLSGFFLLIVAYYANSELYLIDPSINEISPHIAWLVGIGGLAAGWVIYDQLCKSKLGNNEVALALVCFAFVIAMTWFYQQFFSGRAAMLHAGAFMATVMSGNVFFIIMPNQRKVIKQLIAGETPDAKYGKIAKQRSTHNNYVTLPVVFLMISNHYPLSFTTPYAFIIVGLVLIAGAAIRHWFNMHHAKKGNPVWLWAVAIIAMLLAILVSTVSSPVWQDMMSKNETQIDHAAIEEQALEVVSIHCAMCHAAEPAWDGLAAAPKGVRLENDHDIIRMSEAIYKQAGITNAMPPNNLTTMSDEERLILRKWFEKL